MDTMDGMSVAELEALKARVEATIKGKKSWHLGMEAGAIKKVNGEWRGYARGFDGKDVLFALRDGKILYCFPHVSQHWLQVKQGFFQLHNGDVIDSTSAMRCVVLLALAKEA